MSSGSVPDEIMDRLAEALIDKFELPPLGSPNATGPYYKGKNPENAVSTTHDGFRFQLIYRSGVGGNHYNHVHFGVKRTDAPTTLYPESVNNPWPTSGPNS
jgi:hypothetical protein